VAADAGNASRLRGIGGNRLDEQAQGGIMVRLHLAIAAALLALPLASTAQTQTAELPGASTAEPGKQDPDTDEQEFVIQGKQDSGTERQGLLLRLDVRRVPVDVVVIDKHGNPVRGLKQEDFIIKEDNTTQRSLSFDYLDGSVASFVPPKLPPLPTNTFVNLPGEPERGPLCVLYYDMVNTFPEDQLTFHKQLLNFVDKAEPGVRIALFVNMAGLHLIQGFTSDHALLRAAMTSKGPGPHMPDVFLYGENYGRQDMGAAISNLQFLAEYLGGIEGRKNLIWLSSKFPLPQGPVFRPISGNEAIGQSADVVKNAFAAMMRSQVAVYPVDVKGVVLWQESSQSPAGDAAPDVSSTGPSDEQGIGGSGATGGGGAGGNGGAGAAGAGLGTTSGSTTSIAGQTTGASGYSVTSVDQFREEYIAASTGGHAYYSNNDVSGVMEKAVELGESYYTLSYSPTNSRYDGSDRHIEVTLANKTGYKLSYRNLYYAVSDDQIQQTRKKDTLQARFVAAKTGDTLYANIEHGAPMLHDLLFSAHLTVDGKPVLATVEQMMQLEDSPAYFSTRHRDRPQKPPSPVKLQKYRIDYGIFDPQLKALAANGGRLAKLEFAAAAYDADGRLLNSMLNEGLAAAETEVNEKGRALFHAEQELEAPPGAAWIRLAVRDTLNNRTGTLEVRLPLKQEMLSASASKDN
jgi:VWFA-related protein